MLLKQNSRLRVMQSMLKPLKKLLKKPKLKPKGKLIPRKMIKKNLPN